MSITVRELFGTTIKGSIVDLNNEPEHLKAGIKWDIVGDFLHIVDGPRPGANLSTHRIIAEEVSFHLEKCGVDITFDLPTGTYTYQVRPGEVNEV